MFFSTLKYSTLAIALTITGTLLSLIATFVLQSTPFTTLGISTILIGIVTFAISTGQPKIPPQASAILLQSGIENTAALVEELGLKNKAIYLPTTITKDKPKALLPLDPQIKLSEKTLPKRLIVKYGNKPNSLGLLITTAGSTASQSVKAKPDCTAEDIESSISQILVSTLELADSVKVVITQQQITVEVFKPMFENEKMWIYESLGTPTASIVASVVTQTLDKPVTIEKETSSKNKRVIQLKILEDTT
jgi:hypothetical protein